MCVYSMVIDHGRGIWPHPDRMPLPIAPRDIEAERKRLEEFFDLIKRAQDYDKRTGQPHCEDPAKLPLVKQLEERVAALEKALVKKKRKRSAANG